MATLNQKKVFDKVIKNAGKDGKISISKAMREVGFSKSYAKNPKALTETKGWHELLEKHMPDSLLAKVGKEGLKATSVRFDPEGNKIKVDDFATRHKYWETTLKLKGKVTEKVEVTHHEEDKDILVMILKEVQHKHELPRIPDTNEQQGTDEVH